MTGTTPSLLIKYSASQTSGNLLILQGKAGQTALSATGDVGVTGSVTASLKSTFSAGFTDGTATLAAGAITGAKSAALNPASTSGGALVVSNSATQSSGSLVTFTGSVGQTVLSATGNVAVTGGIASTTSLTSAKAILNPNSASGGALIISNTASQSSGSLVTISGKSGYVSDCPCCCSCSS